jgi:DNA (cytosine-5)-methyltransferase 1
MRAIDLFCGAGGSSWGARLAGAEILAGFDAWEAATQAFKGNFPGASVYTKFLEEVDPLSVRRSIGPVELLLASPECSSHSPARGAAERCDQSRDTAFHIVRFADAFKPRWIVVENVVSMRRWPKYTEFKDSLDGLGYHTRELVLNSADFGVPQRRKRLFLICDREVPPSPVRGTYVDHAPASAFLKMNGEYRFSPLRTTRRAAATLERAARAIASVGDRQPFLLVYYTSDKCGGWQPISESLRTITTRDRFALVKPSQDGHVMRMLQVPELKRAMGMPQTFCLGKGPRREQVHLIGNAVCPAVLRAIVRSLRRPLV